MAGMLLAIDYR